MFIYFACPASKPFIEQLKKADAENILFSFAFFPNLKTIKNIFGDWQPKNIIVDSGAFSVWSRGETVNIDDYANFCNDVISHFSNSSINFVNLDVLPGNYGRMPTAKERRESVKRGRENYFYLLEKYNLKTIPVFHQHEDFEDLKRMMVDVNGRGNYLGLSPANDQPMNSKLKWLNQAFSITRDKVKCHGFAVTGFKQLISYPFYSSDSSSWVSGGKFARIPTFDNGRLHGIQFKESDTINKLWKTSTVKDVKLLTDYNTRNYQGALAFKQMEQFITNVWTKRKIIW